MGDKKKTKGTKLGAPSKYTEALADQICAQIASRPVSIKTIAKDVGIDHSVIYEWLFKHQYFADQYARAKEAQAELLAEEIIEISDDSVGDVRFDEDGNPVMNSEFVQRSRLRVDSRKWLASKLKPKKYGDALKLEGDLNLKHSLADKLAAAEGRLASRDEQS